MQSPTTEIFFSLLMLLVRPPLPAGEYLIRGDKIPSYLYHHFDQVEEDVFPRDIRMNVSLTRVAGTLLYSIDRHSNQLIVTLSDQDGVSIMIEFRGQTFGVALPGLCGCERCRFEAVDLRIQMLDEIHLQCNWGTIRRLKYGEKVVVNKAYILPYNGTESGHSSVNGAYLWLVNNPYRGNVYPNNDQMMGCIFGVEYDRRELVFTEVSENVGSLCSSICDDQICHGGPCYETYSVMPMCNCTGTFRNGPYCNESVNPININSSRHVIFDVFKLSWRSSETDILSLENRNVRIRLYQSKEALYLEFGVKGRRIFTTSTLTDRYVPWTEYILVCSFPGDLIDIKLHENGTVYETVLLAGRKMRREVFTSLILRSGNGTMGMVYKTNIGDYFWRKVPLIDGPLGDGARTSPRSEDIVNHTSIPKDEWIWEATVKEKIFIPLVVVSLILTGLIIGLIISLLYIRHIMKSQRSKLYSKKAKGRELSIEMPPQEILI